MLFTCFARNLCNSKSSTDKFSTHSTNSQDNQNRPSYICAAKKALLEFQECESQPVKETKYDVHESDYTNPHRFALPCNPPDECESIDSQDVSMINIIREMAGEEQRLNEELKELSEKELAFKKAMDFCTTMFNEETSSLPENPELSRLKSINRDLLNKKKILTDNLADAKLELKQLKERIDGPLKRELERARRQSMQCQCKYNEAMNTDTDIANNEVTFLKEQLQNACNNINDIHAVNAEIRKEVVVLNLKCKTLEELLIKNKVDEINKLKQVCTCKN